MQKIYKKKDPVKVDTIQDTTEYNRKKPMLVYSKKESSEKRVQSSKEVKLRSIYVIQLVISKLQSECEGITNNR